MSKKKVVTPRFSTRMERALHSFAEGMRESLKRDYAIAALHQKGEGDEAKLARWYIREYRRLYSDATYAGARRYAKSMIFDSENELHGYYELRCAVGYTALEKMGFRFDANDAAKAFLNTPDFFWDSIE